MSESKVINLHISDDVLKEFARVGFKKQEDISILEHISSCDYCTLRYDQYIEEDLLSLPIEFTDRVVKKAKKIRNLRRNGKWQFYGYCFRVGLACACSLVLLFSIDTTKMVTSNISLKGINKEVVSESIAKKIHNIKEYFNNLEVDFNENEKE